MTKKLRKCETREKPLKHRLVFHNCWPSDKSVRAEATSELGRAIKLIGWEVEKVINYTSKDFGSGLDLPQRDQYVLLTYKIRK